MQRVVFLVDMNAFFISCEMTRNPALRGVPAAVAGDPKKRTGIILAANYEARAFGVRTAMVLHEAQRLCPQMLLVPPDHGFYSRMSDQVMELLCQYTPLLEQNSIDEAWLDMSGTQALFGTPLDAAKRIMQEIEQTLGLWCSVGISYNKFLAKMASEMKKPQGITQLWQTDLSEKLWPLPVRAMYGVGGKTAQKLNLMGIETIGDLAKSDAGVLGKVLGKFGYEVHRHGNGIDDSPVQTHAEDGMKSISRETTLSENVTDSEKAKTVLMELADDVGMSVRRHGKKGRTVHITLKYADFNVITRQITIKPTNSTEEIYRAGCRLLEQNWDKEPVRLIGIGVSRFEEDSQQMSIFDLQADSKDERAERIDRTIDSIRTKHGNASITLAKLVKRQMDSKEDS